MNPLDFFKQHEANRDCNIEFDLTSSGKLKEIAGKEKVGFREYIGNDYLQKAKRMHRGSNPIAANQADIVYWVIYDRYFVVAGGTMPGKWTYFQVPIGQNITTSGNTYSKTKQDTNLTQVSTLEAPQWMNTIGMGVYFSSQMIKPDIDCILDNTYLEYWVTAKIYAEGSLQLFPAGAGLYGMSDQTGQAAWQNGWPQATNVFDLRLPAGIHLGMGTDDSGNPVPITTDGLMGITILQSQTFHVDFKQDVSSGNQYSLNSLPYVLKSSTATPQAGTGYNAMVYLYGILSRGVQ
jgi:hypothetical protein